MHVAIGVCLCNNKLMNNEMLAIWKPTAPCLICNDKLWFVPSIPNPKIDYEIICLPIAQAYAITNGIERNITYCDF